MGIRPLVGGEPPTELAGADRADDGVAVAPGVDLDPRLAEVDGAVGVVGRDLHEGDRGRLVEWIAPAGLRHLDRVEGDAARADSADALPGLLHRRMGTSRMVQTEKPSGNQPLPPFHPELIGGVGVFGETHPPRPMRPVDFGHTYGIETEPRKPGSYCTRPPRG